MAGPVNCIRNLIHNLCLYLGAILVKTEVWGNAAWLQSVTAASSLSWTTNKLRFLTFMWMPMYVIPRVGQAKRCLEVNQLFPLRQHKEILHGVQLWIYYPGTLPHFQHWIPTTTFEKQAACTSFSYTLLILTSKDVRRWGIMKLVEQKKNKQTNSHKSSMLCAYLLKVVVWGNICWQGLCSPCLEPPILRHLLGKNRVIKWDTAWDVLMAKCVESWDREMKGKKSEHHGQWS